jgi:type VI secretion system secreted protein Hcp
VIFLKFATEIKGEVTEAGHEGWMNVDSIQFGVGRSITSTGGGSDRETSNPSFSEVTFTRGTDKASPELWMQAIAGKSLGMATVHFVQTGGVDKKQTYMMLEFDESIVSNYSTSSGGTW